MTEEEIRRADQLAQGDGGWAAAVISTPAGAHEHGPHCGCGHEHGEHVEEGEEEHETGGEE